MIMRLFNKITLPVHKLSIKKSDFDSVPGRILTITRLHKPIEVK